MPIPELKKFFLTTGAAEGITPLNAFDAALLNAGIGNANLLKLTSIIPPDAVMIKPIPVKPGSILPAAFTYITSDIPGEIISAGVGVGLPVDRAAAGLIMEYAAKSHKNDVKKIIIKMLREGFKYRDQKIRIIKTNIIEYKVKRLGVAFAAVVFCNP